MNILERGLVRGQVKTPRNIKGISYSFFNIGGFLSEVRLWWDKTQCVGTQSQMSPHRVLRHVLEQSSCFLSLVCKFLFWVQLYIRYIKFIYIEIIKDW